jgi:hypothetical protein
MADGYDLVSVGAKYGLKRRAHGQSKDWARLFPLLVSLDQNMSSCIAPVLL